MTEDFLFPFRRNKNKKSIINMRISGREENERKGNYETLLNCEFVKYDLKKN